MTTGRINQGAEDILIYISTAFTGRTDGGTAQGRRRRPTARDSMFTPQNIETPRPSMAV